MSTYVIGDIQGCLNELKQLLNKINFSADKDIIWFAGDLVNRGPKSLETLRYIKSMDKNAISVLGNHELHMLAIIHGLQKPRPNDTFDEIIKAKDKDRLMEWVAQRPLIHTANKNQQVLVHAGIYPLWSISEAKLYAEEVEKTLRSDQLIDFLSNMYGNQPDQWNEKLVGWERLRFITNTFTRMRYCSDNHRLDLKSSVAPEKQTAALTPWFTLRSKQNIDTSDIFFGHWSTLGKINENGIYCLDTGCLWGGKLTALKIDDFKNNNKPHYFQINCKGEQKPIKN